MTLHLGPPKDLLLLRELSIISRLRVHALMRLPGTVHMTPGGVTFTPGPIPPEVQKTLDTLTEYESTVKQKLAELEDCQ